VDAVEIAVLGCGTMGAGIASVLADAAHAVTVFDADPELARRTAAAVPGVRAAVTLQDAVTGAAVIFEAIAEDEGAKRQLIEELGRLSPDAILASNTSSISAALLAQSAHDRSRFLLAHFFNPAVVVPLVEIVPVEGTSFETVSAVRDLLAAAGKEPVVLGREVPGLIANRLQAALLREAFSLERSGVAPFADIDRVVRSGLGSRWAAGGPFAIVDLGGVDIWAAVTSRLFPTLSNEEGVPDALATRLRDGRLGAKSGEGLFEHDATEDDALRARIAAHFTLEFHGSTS
jgi:3-hydroxybutyryl-CoA dehydrogenase